MTVKELIEDYKRRINTINEILKELEIKSGNVNLQERKRKRLIIKKSYFIHFISELEKIKKS